MKYLKDIYIKQQFFPNLLGCLVNPFYFARKGLAFHISSLSENITGLTLDIGCGSKPYKGLFASTKYYGLEIDTPENRKRKQADFFYDGNSFPFNDEEFDSLVANQVFEHVFNPDNFLTEVNRVLKKNGKILITVPFIWDEHEQPYDYARYSSFGLKFILEKHGFEVLEQKKSIDDIRVIFQLINTYLYKKTVTKSPLANLFFCLIFMSPFNILGQLLAKITPRNSDLYLDSIVLAKKVRMP
jgi:SAM-dependent methyltransferase